MKLKLPLKKLLRADARAALTRVMEKWKEPKDVFALACIAKAIDAQIEAAQEASKVLIKQHGYELPSGPSVSGEAIGQHLISEHGKPSEKGGFTLEGIDASSMEAFRASQKEAEEKLKEYGEASDAMMDEEQEIEFPRLIKVKEKDLKEGRITAQDCYLLMRFLDLEAVGFAEDGKKEKAETENEE